MATAVPCSLAAHAGRGGFIGGDGGFMSIRGVGRCLLVIFFCGLFFFI